MADSPDYKLRLQQLEESYKQAEERQKQAESNLSNSRTSALRATFIFHETAIHSYLSARHTLT